MLTGAIYARTMPIRSPALPVVLQAAAVAVAPLVLALWPPVSGPMMLVPLAGDTGAVTRAALAGGARLLGSGPLPGSLVVMGDRAGIARRLGGWDVVITAAPPAGCGTLAGTA